MQDIRPACTGGSPALCFLRCGGNSAGSSTFFSRYGKIFYRSQQPCVVGICVQEGSHFTPDG